MDERLVTIKQMLDTDEALKAISLLDELTTFHRLDKLWFMPLKKLKHLYISGDEFYLFREVRDYFKKPGIRVDRESEWMMVNGADKNLVRWLLARCSSGLTVLEINNTDLTGTLDLARYPVLRRLSIWSLTGQMTVKGLGGLYQLEELNLHNVDAGEDLDVSRMDALTDLEIADVPIRHICGLQKLHLLKRLSLQSTKQQGTLCLDGLNALEYINITATPFDSITLHHPLFCLDECWAVGTEIQDAAFLAYMPHVKEICFAMTPVRSLPSLEKLECLAFLSFSCTKLDSLDTIGLPACLSILHLNRTSIRKLPESIRGLKNLTYLDLSDMELEELPDWLPELGMPFLTDGQSDGIQLKNTRVKDVDMSIFDQPQEMILQWFEERHREHGPRPLNELKVVFLGDGEAGKSLSIARLLRDGAHPHDFEGSATPGIDITDKEYTLEDGRSIRVHFWDFGGQEIMHSMHRLFLTGRTLYVVLINARDDTQDDRARYWLHNVKSFANGSPVLLVLNKLDQNPNASVNEPELRRLYSGLTEVVRMSALTDSPEEFRNRLTAALLRQIRDFQYLQSPFHSSWSALKRSLEGMSPNYIYGSDYEQLCSRHGVQDSREVRKALLDWFNDLGVSFYYGDRSSVGMEDYVILRPDWITNAIYIILFNRTEAVDNGIIPIREIMRMLCPSDADRKRFRRVNETARYSREDIQYVLNVLERFRLCYRMDDQNVFIPMLCQRNSLPVVEHYAVDPKTVEFRLDYDYLPNNVLHRLMVERRQELDMDNVWLTGARFELAGTGLSAVVKCEDRLMKFYVRAEREEISPRVYLAMLLDHVVSINESLSIAEPVKQIIFKDDGGEECFDYDMLTGCLNCGIRETYSVRRRRPLLISQILGDVGFSATLKRERQLRSVLKKCQPIPKNASLQRMDRLERARFLYELFLGHKGRKDGISDQGLPDDLPFTFVHASESVMGGGMYNSVSVSYPTQTDAQCVFSVVLADCCRSFFDRLISDPVLLIPDYGPKAAAILDPVVGGVELDPERLRMLQYVYDRNKKLDHYVIFVRIGE